MNFHGCFPFGIQAIETAMRGGPDLTDCESLPQFVLLEEFLDSVGDFFPVCFECEVTGI